MEASQGWLQIPVLDECLKKDDEPRPMKCRFQVEEDPHGLNPDATKNTKLKKAQRKSLWKPSRNCWGQVRKMSSIISTSKMLGLINSALCLVLSLLILLSLGRVEASSNPGVFDGMCPVPECYCGLDGKGRMEVSCTSGGLDEISTSKMSPALEVIKIVGPKQGKPNHLNIGRFFRQFRKLDELHIVGCNVPNIGERNFLGVNSLRLLNLSRNNINLVVDGNFIGLDGLEVLSLRENQIESFVSASFQHLPKLKVLDLSRNRVALLVERLFYNLHLLESLDLSDNRLRELNADVFRDIWRLKLFRCQRCQLKAIAPLWYSLLPALKTLDLGYNEFSTLMEGEFGALKSIEEINLEGNRLRSLPEYAFRTTRLERLTLSWNGLSSIDRTAFVNASVWHLDLSGNKFESLNKLIFLDLKGNLSRLDLSRNPHLKLSSLLIILSENKRLKWLSLARNNYEDLPLDLFEDNRPLQHLNLSWNRLKELFPRQFSLLLNLQILDLSHNRLRGIEGEVLTAFDRISTIREIRLEGNPWACDLCHIPPLHKWVQNSPIFRKGCTIPSSPFCLRCVRPASQYSRALLDLDESELEWCDPYGEEEDEDSRLGLILGVGLVVLLLVLMGGGLLVRYWWWEASYYTHEEMRAGTGTPPIPDYQAEPLDSYYATINGGHPKMVATIQEKGFSEPNLNPLHHSFGRATAAD